ncbi:MAG TPA: hypothetical protein VFZ52_18815 [Chryseolinea sp.]
MKKSIIILSFLTMTISSFKTITEYRIAKSDAAAERMAVSVVNALRHRSLQEYTELFPSVEAFHQIMEKNASFYGENLAEAKEEFEVNYTLNVLPALNQSFKTIIAQGLKEGIDWSTIKLISFELNEQTADAPSTIAFSSNDKKYRLEFDRTLHINGEWKVSQYVKLCY